MSDNKTEWVIVQPGAGPTLYYVGDGYRFASSLERAVRWPARDRAEEFARLHMPTVIADSVELREVAALVEPPHAA